MSYVVIWKYFSEDQTSVLAGHPGTDYETEKQAVEEGRKIHAKLLEYDPGIDLTPLAVVEYTEPMAAEILEQEEKYLGDEDDDELFYDVTSLPYWEDEDWWVNEE